MKELLSFESNINAFFLHTEKILSSFALLANAVKNSTWLNPIRAFIWLKAFD